MDDLLLIDLHDAMLFGELMPVTRVVLTDVYDRQHEILILEESAEALRDALDAALATRQAL
ncbi:hypothetical protein BH11ACT6_BH11ACT6_03720 [soil metagenome]